MVTTFHVKLDSFLICAFGELFMERKREWDGDKKITFQTLQMEAIKPLLSLEYRM